MKKIIISILLALLVVGGAVLEGLFELPASLIQMSGLINILSAAALIIWTLKLQLDTFRKR